MYRDGLISVFVFPIHILLSNDHASPVANYSSPSGVLSCMII